MKCSVKERLIDIGVLSVIEDGKLIDYSTAFVIEGGLICTAYHVLAGNNISKYSIADLEKSGIRFFFRRNDDLNEFIECKVYCLPTKISLKVKEKDLTINNDILFLIPNTKIRNGISLRKSSPKVSSDAYVLGYPSDVPPYEIEIQTMRSGLFDQKYYQLIETSKRKMTSILPIVKKCIFSRVDQAYINEKTIVYSRYLIDTTVFPGGSGSPVIDCEGNLLAVVSKQILAPMKQDVTVQDTSLSISFLIPSGLTECIGLEAICFELRNFYIQSEFTGVRGFDLVDIPL